MTRTHSFRELLLGPTFFVLVMVVVGTCFFRTQLGILIMCALGWGDGVAPFVGVKFGGAISRALGGTTAPDRWCINGQKSLEGSIAFFLASFLAACFFSTWLSIPIAPMLALKVSLIAAISEAISPSDADNIVIPLVVAGSFHLLQV
eukprot:CAMPEP_0177641408 /NCGR_PEP_ID=MMETSP0447-20121125/7048_1 /TAXON_ID=0 /ORGANISM="Stygamoeba regulata, Strain BSH-02190019" /LENGTH=146 /DNA_ID=CAMNT_0019143519 /DNA_START=266 /DNA_END=706 /DNA_ORIENTATION=-